MISIFQNSRSFAGCLALCASLVAVGCGDDGGSDSPTATLSGGGTDPSTTTDSDSGSMETGSTSMDTSMTGMTDLSHDADIQPIWTASCATPACHDGMTFPPDLTDGNAYDAIVGVASAQSDLNFIEPGSSEDSYIWHKLNDTQVEAGGSGLLMPYNPMDPVPLPADQIAIIEEWIDGGAPQ